MFCLFLKQIQPGFCTRILHMKVRFIYVMVTFCKVNVFFSDFAEYVLQE